MYFVCYELNKKDKDTLLKSVENEAYRSVLSNLEYLDSDMVSEHSKKFRRRRDDMSSEQFSDFTRRLSSSEYEILRTDPLICTLIKQIHDNTIDTKRYPLVVERYITKKGPSVSVKKRGAAVAESEFERQDALEMPRIFTFIIGGLSHHEIVSIANL